MQIVIADDHNLFIEGLLLLLKDEPQIEIAGIANEAGQLLQWLSRNKADMVLLDINMPGPNGLEALQYIKGHYPGLKVIILSTYSEEYLIRKAKNYGADGYIIKNTCKEALLETIHDVYRGKSCFPETNSGQAAAAFIEDDSFLAQFHLTKREKELLQLIKKKYTNQQIAEQLHLSIYTVETHRKNIMQKLKLEHKNPVELTQFILKHNL